MRRFSTLVIIFLLVCAVCILLMHSCGRERTEEPKETPVSQGVPEEQATPAPTAAPTPAPTPGPETVWTTDGVNLRKGPSTDDEVIGTVEKNTQLERTETTSTGWSKVLYAGEVCYVSSSYLTTTAPVGVTTAPTMSFNVTPCSDTVWTMDGVNLRRGPGTDYEIAAAVDKDTKLERTGTTDNNWSRVIYNNVGYFVSNEFITTTEPETAAPEAPAPTEAPAATASAEAPTSGEFKQETESGLTLIIRWKAERWSDGTKGITLEAYVSSATLHVDAVADDICFKVGNNTYNVTSKGVNVDSESAVETLLGTCVTESTQSSVPVTVIWRFNGTYGGVEIESIEASDTLAFGG